MAFYSVRLDDKGKEIETTRRTSATYRKLFLNHSSLENETNRGEILNTSKTRIICSSENNSIKNDQNVYNNRQQLQNYQNNQDNNNNNNNNERANKLEYGDSKKMAITKNTYKTVRYVNSATFIEKDQIKSNQIDNDNSNQSDNGDGSSTNRSHEINDHQQYQSHIVMESIPLLELNSNDSFPSSVENLTYSYRKVCEVTKMITKPDAYSEWLIAKRFAKSYEIKRKLEEEKRKEEEKKLRKRLAEEKFRKWLILKAEKLKNDKEKQNNDKLLNNDGGGGVGRGNKNYEKEKYSRNYNKKSNHQNDEFKCGDNKMTKNNLNEISNLNNYDVYGDGDGDVMAKTITATEINDDKVQNENDNSEVQRNNYINDDNIDREKHIQLWLKRKLQKLKEQKDKFNEKTKYEKELERKRREQASIVYKEWLKTAPYKPKPVPLSQGLLTLRGCMSNLYVNPNPWVPPIEEVAEK